MKKYLILSCIILVIAISLLSTDEAKPESLKGKVTEFSATDMPFDDGAGIVLKWKPLDKSYPVIKYSIFPPAAHWQFPGFPLWLCSASLLSG